MRIRGIGSTGTAPSLASLWRRRLGSAALAFGVVTSGVVAVSASPAQAVPGVFTVSNGSAEDATPLKTIDVPCAAPNRVYGGGASIQGGFGDVVITSITPNVGLNRISVTAIQRVPLTTPWRVIARAVCGPETPSMSRAVASATGSPPAAVTPTCPAGSNLFGLGMAINNSVSDQTSAATVTRMVPTSATQATIQAAETRTFAGNWQLVGYGICAAPAAGRVIISGTSTSTSDTLQQANATCAGTTRVHGVGMEVLPGAGVATGDLILNSLATVGGSTLSSTVLIYERGTGITGVHRARSFGICAS